jgi:spore coat protein H
MITMRRWIRGWFVGTLIAFAGLSSALAARYGGAKADPSDELFTNTTIRHLRIEIDAEEMRVLRRPVPRSRNSSERPSVPATVREGDLLWTNVAVHIKGSLGSFRPIDDKPALTLNFDKLAKEQRFHGLQKVSLNNSVQDPSYLSEKICREIYTTAGVPMPRSDFATVELNGRPLGLFVLVEGWNKQFLRRHFKNAKGNFYDLGGNRDVHTPTNAAFGEDPTNHAALNAVKASVNERDHFKRMARLRQTVDLDRFVTMHALDVLMWNWDGYGLNRNNFRLFHDLDANRIVFLPHGVDQMFWKANGPIMTGRAGLVAKSLLETAEGRRIYLDRFRELRANVFDARVLTNRMAELSARLRPALMNQGVLAVAQQQQAAQQLSRYIMARAQDVDAQLASVKNFAPLELNTVASLTNWMTRREMGDVGFSQTTNTPAALRIHVSDAPSIGAWVSTVWLEEGRYRIEGRVKTLGVQSMGEEGGAGFRVWSSRKETRGASWGWFPYSSTRDPRTGGMIPVFTNTPQQRLVGDKGWTPLTYEFELRQPLADLQIQCALQASSGAAWFDLSSLKIRRVAMSVTKSSVKGD